MFTPWSRASGPDNITLPLISISYFLSVRRKPGRDVPVFLFLSFNLPFANYQNCLQKTFDLAPYFYKKMYSTSMLLKRLIERTFGLFFFFFINPLSHSPCLYFRSSVYPIILLVNRKGLKRKAASDAGKGNCGFNHATMMCKLVDGVINRRM